MRIQSIALIGVMLFSLTAHGTIIHVPGDQPTIQAGIDSASTGDTVLVADGTYTGSGNTNIYLNWKAIVIMSENGAESCIINCEFLGRGFYIGGYPGINLVIEGFTIMYASTSGMFIVNSDPLIRGCIYKGNRSTYGGGINITNGSSPSIVNCTFYSNTASDGGGIAILESSPELNSCIFLSNRATG